MLTIIQLSILILIVILFSIIRFGYYRHNVLEAKRELDIQDDTYIALTEDVIARLEGKNLDNDDLLNIKIDVLTLEEMQDQQDERRLKKSGCNQFLNDCPGFMTGNSFWEIVYSVEQGGDLDKALLHANQNIQQYNIKRSECSKQFEDLFWSLKDYTF